LQRDGVPPREAVAICAATSIEYAITFLAALRAGAVAAPLAPSSTPAALAAMIADCGARLLFADRAVAAALRDAEVLPSVTLIGLDDVPHARGWHDWIEPMPVAPQPVSIEPDWPFNIIYSSGTTGAPKGIVQPHQMRWTQVRRASAFGFSSDAVSLVSTPLYSNTTLVNFLPTLALGGAVVLMAKFDARRFLQLSQQHRVTHAMLVPVQYRRLLADPEFDRFDLSSFRMKFCTSAPFAAELKAEVLRRWPGGLVEYYGMTEGGGTCILLAHERPDKLHTVGRPAEGHDVRLIDDAGREVAPGEAGEVVGRSGAMMSGYHGQPRMTRDAEWYDAPGNRFIRTGDIGRFDDEGFLTLIDRKKDMIISGGFNIYPSDLEAVLREHPAVADASVVGVPSDRWGETPVAFVVLRPGERAEPDAIRQWANARLGATQRLADVVVSAELPRSPIGKVLKRALRDAYLGQSA
ncbi:MAG TPA: class I adenylate-forming enzyme family protein, partial [Burkholderiaceae bacterium]|nr:class I adenylate-forming enzyme family protein [Burkholderiaceae bacterium]